MPRHPRIEFYNRQHRSTTITGRDPLPRHLAVAFGRYIFRLMHTPPNENGFHEPSIYLRDTSLAVDEHLPAYRSYLKECRRHGKTPLVSRSPSRSWWRSTVPDPSKPILL